MTANELRQAMEFGNLELIHKFFAEIERQISLLGLAQVVPETEPPQIEPPARRGVEEEEEDKPQPRREEEQPQRKEDERGKDRQ